jgi:ATP-dependent exoDNAse (exonuclease V) beta subunit
LRQIASDIATEQVRPRSDKQVEQHRAALEWSLQVTGLPQAIAPAHFSVLNRRKLDVRSLVKQSAACRHEAEIRSLCERLARHAVGDYYAAERQLIVEALHAIDAEYRKRKRAVSALDFDDLEEFTIRLLEGDSALRKRVQSSFDYILMDELQDTNPLQWRLMELVRQPRNFFAVGDVNQSIYGFRHAAPALFTAYRRRIEEAGLTVDELRDNYRTRDAVLDVVNRIFDAAPGVEPHRLAAATSFPGKAEPSVEALVMFGESGPETEIEEAAWVAQRIAELAGSLETARGPLRFGDIAVLTRANSSTAALQSALDAYGVPSVVLGGFTLFDTREIRDLALLLQVLVNPRNEVALAGLLRSPLFGCSDEDLLRFAQGGSLYTGVKKNPPEYWDTIRELRALRNQVTPDVLVRRVIDERDYESGLSDRARANVEKFLAMLRKRYNETPAPLATLVAAIGDASPEAEAPPQEFANAVQLMTLHKAKGLEFPVVFLPFLHRGRSYGFPIISFTHEHGLGVKWRNPATETGQGDVAWYANRDESNLNADAEENRLLYVGMTRAREHLVLSWSSTGRERGQWPRLISSKLELPTEAPSNETVVVSGVRVLATDRSASRAASAAASIADASVNVIDLAPAALSAEGSATVTDISRFQACPRKYYLSRYLGWETTPRRLPAFEDDDCLDDDAPDEISASELGRQVHALLANQPAPDVPAVATELADRFRTSALGKRSLRASHSAHEWDFVMEVGGLVLRGQIDLWFEAVRELIVVDYKTDREIDREAADGYSLQLQLYALALERHLGRKPDRAVLFSLRDSREIEVDLTPLALSAAMDAVHRFREAQERQSFPLVVDEHCRRCEFYAGLCPAGRPAGSRPAEVATDAVTAG